MDIEITSGNQQYNLRFSHKADIEMLKPKGLEVIDDLRSELEKTLLRFNRKSIDGMLGEAVPPKRVALVVADDVLPEYLEIVLPNFLDRITSLWSDFEPAMITIIARKAHGRGPGAEKFQAVLRNEVNRGFRLIFHDPILSKMTDCGKTTLGTPILINSDLAEADLKIVIGQLYPHQMVGFTGGANAVTSGCAGGETLEAMNRLMFENTNMMGCLKGHPMRVDLAEAFGMARINLAFSLILDPKKRPVRLMLGASDEVLKEAAEICTDHFGVAIPSRFDIVVASCGEDSPHHFRKTLLMTSQVVKKGGKVLILASNSNLGIGKDIFFNYVCHSMCPETLMEAFKTSGMQLALGEANLLEQALINKEMDLTVGFDKEITSKCQLRAADPTAILGAWIDEFETSPRVAVIPDKSAMCCFTG